MINEIFSTAAQQGIHLYLKDGRLAYKAHGGDISAEFKTILVAHKTEIIEFLQLQTAVAVEGLQPIKPVDPNEKSRPLSYGQQRLWLLNKIDGGGAHYNISSGIRLRGLLNVQALTAAFTHIVARHESLRTCFVSTATDEPTPIVKAAAPFSILFADLSLLKEGDRQTQLATHIASEFGYVFDLSCDLMLRVKLIKMADDEHIVLVSMHHIASDGWSMGILINELSKLYSAYSQGEENPLKPLPIQYADYAYWQRNWLQGEVLDQQMHYWTKQLADIPVVHGLPLDHTRPVVQTFVGNSIDSHIDAETIKTLNALCQTHGATLFMGLHAAFAVLLSRYSHEKDVVIGTPIANREQAEVAELIGFFANTLVLRTDLSENPSFNELLNQSKTILLDAYAHQQTPFEKIVEYLQPERSLSHSALFQIMLILQNNARSVLELPGLTLSPLEQHGIGVAKFDLTLNVIEDEKGLWLSWEYNTDLFNSNTITRMAMHFELLLKALLNKPDEDVFNIEMLNGEEREQLLVKWNSTHVDYPNDKHVHELFEVQAENTPDAIAVVFEGKQLTYAELNQRANQLAHYLINEKNITSDSLVGICVERSLDMIIGILAILKAGGAYVPLDPDYPEARLKYMLDDAKLTLVLTQYHLRETTPVSEVQALYLDEKSITQMLQQQAKDNPNSKDLGVTDNHLAYVIYTSGSTGSPKGVLVERRGLKNLVYWYAHEYQFSAQDRNLIVSSIGFDLTQKNIFAPLVSGGQIILLRSGPYDPVAIVNKVKSHSVSIINCAPSLFYGVVECAADNYQSLGSLRLVLLGGEPIKSTSLSSWLDHPECKAALVNMYGPTECTDIVTSSVEKNNVIGRVIANTSVYVVNENYQLCHVGGVGELCVAGVGLARGYLNNPDLTTKKFVVNPFYDKSNPLSSERLYKTGDLVRWLPDGNLEFLGRLDHQVKIRGFRVEPGEIECLLNLHPDVKDVIVISRESAVGDKYLVAYIATDAIDPEPNSVTSESSRSLIENLRHHVRQTLPDYMVPSAFVLLHAFPLSPNGKIDRKALPDPDLSLQQNVYVAPRTETEKKLCDIWQEVLGVERVGVTDNFFNLGGVSLSAVRIVAKINKKTNTTFNVGELFNSQTIELLAIKIEQNDMLSSIALNEDQELALDEMELKI